MQASRLSVLLPDEPVPMGGLDVVVVNAVPLLEYEGPNDLVGPTPPVAVLQIPEGAGGEVVVRLRGSEVVVGPDVVMVLLPSEAIGLTPAVVVLLPPMTGVEATLVRGRCRRAIHHTS